MRIIFVVIIGLILAGCSQTPTTVSKSKVAVDGDYVAAVERAAEQASVDVIWINPPTRKTEQNQH